MTLLIFIWQSSTQLLHNIWKHETGCLKRVLPTQSPTTWSKLSSLVYSSPHAHEGSRYPVEQVDGHQPYEIFTLSLSTELYSMWKVAEVGAAVHEHGQ